MTATIARLILAMLLLPVSAAVFVLGFAITIRAGGPPSTAALLLLWGCFYSFVATYWLLLWRRSVRWTNARVGKTALAAVGSLAGGSAVAAGALAVIPQIPTPIAVLIGGGVVPIVWVLATVLMWRETPAERVERMSGLLGKNAIVCPICGYNLAGLRQARCPECGAVYTLDDLVAAQPHRQEHPADL